LFRRAFIYFTVRYGASKESETPYFLEGCVARTLVTAVPPPSDFVLPGRPSIQGVFEVEAFVPTRDSTRRSKEFQPKLP
jgi:hypothetical protein